MQKSHDALKSLGLPSTDLVQLSGIRFKDGGEYRVEIPSVEGPKVLAEAEDLGVPVIR